jgi:hypothetical protein
MVLSQPTKNHGLQSADLCNQLSDVCLGRYADAVVVDGVSFGTAGIEIVGELFGVRTDDQAE